MIRQRANALKWRWVWLHVVLVVGLLFIAVGLFLWLWTPAGHHYNLRVTAGSGLGRRHQNTLKIADNLRSFGITLNIQPSAGSNEALDRVHRRDLDLALVQGGIALANRTDVRQVAVLGIEPLHLLVREKLFKPVTNDITSLRGKRINISKSGSGTDLLAREVLRFAGLKLPGPNQKGDFFALHWGRNQLLDKLKRIPNGPDEARDKRLDKLPDAIFAVEKMPSRIVRKLVTLADYRLVPLPFGKVIGFHDLYEELHARDKKDLIVESQILETEIPAFTYGYSPKVPAQPCPTIGTRLLLVAHKDVPSGAIFKLLDFIFHSPYTHIIEPAKLSEQLPQYPLHQGTVAYQKRNKPFIASDVLDWFLQAGSILGLLCGGSLAVYGFFRWRRLLKFESFFHEVRKVGLVARGFEKDAKAPTTNSELLAYLEGRLDDLKHQAVGAFASGYLYGEGVLEALLSFIGDTRTSMRKILAPVEDEASTAGMR